MVSKMLANPGFRDSFAASVYRARPERTDLLAAGAFASLAATDLERARTGLNSGASTKAIQTGVRPKGTNTSHGCHLAGECYDQRTDDHAPAYHHPLLGGGWSG